MIHVCFSLHDQTGAYAKFTGTAMLSLFENTKSKVTVHLLHDNTLTNDNRDKFTQIADRYGQLIKFYNIEELINKDDKLIQKIALIPNEDTRFSVAMFYRFFIHRLLPIEIEKIIYLDSDIIVNLDIEELWQIDLVNEPLGVVPEILLGVQPKRASMCCRDGFVAPEDYFNSGVLLMNLKTLRKEEDTLFRGIEFRAGHPEYSLYDQEILNYCFAARALKLPMKYNCMVKNIRKKGEVSIEKRIYHYAGKGYSLGIDMKDSFNHLWMSYFIKTPWFGVDIVAIEIGTYLPSQKNYPISVVIPLYNAEKCISDCLDSLLAQTFQDFEIVIVDDCSTDSSCKIVESYVPKFNDRLKLYHLKENSGSGGAPRTKGITLSRGEYVFFLDADDMLENVALEKMYSLTKYYDTDVVYFEKHYYSDEDGSNIKKNTTKGASVSKPTFEPQDLKERVDRVIKGWYKHVPWLNLVRRNLMIENGVFFPQICPSEDFVWMYALVFYAKKFLRVPDAVYIYRRAENSMMRKEKTPQETVNFRVSPLLEGLKIFDELLGRHEFFKANPDCRYALLKRFVSNEVNNSVNATKELSDDEVFSTIRDKYSDKLGKYEVLISALFTALYNEKRRNVLLKFKDFLTARIDIKFMTTKGNFLILSTSDENANVSKPTWLQKDGVGYVIKSLNGELTFVVKATSDGQISLNLKSSDIREPKDKSKHIPYWLDYTKLIVNDKIIFDTITPAWHDKPYRYTIEAKANEELTIHVEWLPHRSDNVDVKALPPKVETLPLPIVEIPHPPKVVTPPPPKVETPPLPKVETPPPPKVETPPLPKVETPPPPIVETLPPPKVETPPPPIVETLPPPIVETLPPLQFETARIDVKMLTRAMGDFQILSVSDDKANITKPSGLQDNGVGYMLTSSAGNLMFVAKATADGQINLKLRGMNIRDPKNKSKRIPKWIIYTKLIVNDKTIFDKRTPAWHDKPYVYKVDVKAEEEIKIRVEWLPHRSDTVDESKVMPPPPPKVVTPPPPKVETPPLPVVETPPPPVVETPPPPKVETLPPPVVETPPPPKVKTLPPLQFETARIDVKMLTRAMGDFQILSVSDDKANITKPSVLQDNGVGYMLTSSAGNLMFVAKATADGQINLKLRGMNIRDPKNKSKRIPKWIIYTKLIVNEETIFDEFTPAWHDKPHIYKMDVKAGEEIKIHVEWQPRKSDT